MTVARFLNSLFEMLSKEDPSVVRWSDDGTAFYIMDNALMEGDILPRYYNHTKLKSFHRQLNYFGFRKWTKTQSFVATFSHPDFLRDQPQRLCRIQRRRRSRSKKLQRQLSLDSVASTTSTVGSCEDLDFDLYLSTIDCSLSFPSLNVAAPANSFNVIAAPLKLESRAQSWDNEMLFFNTSIF